MTLVCAKNLVETVQINDSIPRRLFELMPYLKLTDTCTATKKAEFLCDAELEVCLASFKRKKKLTLIMTSILGYLKLVLQVY